jgi:hypothetical protein
VRSLSWQNYPRKKQNNNSKPRIAIGRMNLTLGIEPKQEKELNDEEELEKLADIIKQAMFQDYKVAYSEKGDAYKEEAQSTVTVG